MPDLSDDPRAILARGAGRGITVEEFGPVWTSARLRLSRAGWQAATLEPFLDLAVPYTSTSSGRLSDDAARIALAARPGAPGLRILELGAGSGIFARLFLNALQRRAPDVYARSHYVVTDGSPSILDAQRAQGVLDGHAAIVSHQVLDSGSDWTAPGPFDVVLCSYLLDSLAFDLLAICDTQVWRREVRAVLPETRLDDAAALRAALSAADDAALPPLAHLGPLLGLHTRHVPLTRAEVPLPHTLPSDTGGETVPWVQCWGALSCIDRAIRHLAPGGVMIFSDYGHLSPHASYDSPELQGFGQSVAVGLNFPQMATALRDVAGLRFHAPAEEDGHLYTRVVQNGDGPDLAPLVDEVFGALRHRALTAPIDAAREVIRGRMFESARGFYAKALHLQPQNWYLMQEIALLLLLPNGEHGAALDMAGIGLSLNPLAPDLWRAQGEALAGLGRDTEATAALDRAVALAPGNVAAHLARARIALRQRDPGQALAGIALALTHDHDGDAREALLALQDQTLGLIAQVARERLQASVNAVMPQDGLPRPDHAT